MPPPVRQRPRSGLRTSAAGLVAIAAGALLALPPAAGAQEPPPETAPTPEPPVTLEAPEPLPVDTTTITIHVPQPTPAPRPKVQVKAKVARAEPAEEPTRREEVQPEPVAEVTQVEQPYAAPERVARPKARPRTARAKSVVAARAFAPRQLERGLAERVSESAAFSEADNRVPTAAVLGVTAGDAAPFGAEGTGGGPSSFVLFLGALGVATLMFAGAMPLLAAYSPETFVPVLRVRRDVSFVGLCLLASGLTGLLAWAILGT